ncbi:hypothetical protein BG006_009577, partial [Podila minutissima]
MRYFTQMPSSLPTPSASDSPTNTTASSSSSSGSPPSTASAGINYIGMYDSQLKRFLPLAQGLDGPVQDLVCDDASGQVYVVGGFRAPVPDMSTAAAAATGGGGGEGFVMTEEYEALGVFGGGVAVWKPTAAAGGQTSCAGGHCYKAQGSWAPLPFKGMNGVVNSVAKAQDGTFWFGGRFDTTTDGEQFSAPDTQPVNMDSVKVFSGNGLDNSQERNIICDTLTNTRRNWLMRDNIPGFWRAQFPLYITPTLFRLWNVDTTAGPDAANRGTKTFSIMAQPSNQLLNLSYVDRATDSILYCTVCPLQQRTTSAGGTSGDGGGFQDFVVVTPVLLQAAQVDVVSWYGRGGGLGGIEVFQSEIFVRAVSELNLSSQCSTIPGANVAASAEGGGGGSHGDYGMTAYSTSMGADWKTIKMPDGWQTVLAASVSATDEGVRKPAYVDLAPYLQESGMYDVYLYTPACGGTYDAISSNSAGPLPSNACANRGSVDVNMYFGSPGNVVTMTMSQTNTRDKADKIYSGMIVHSTGDFRPHVVVGPSISTTGTSGGGNTMQTVIVDSIQFVKQATLNSTNSMLFYRPGTGQVSSDPSAPTKDKAQGLDASTWGNLPTQLPSGAVVNSLAASLAGSASLLFISGEFQGTGFSNIVAWDGSKFVPLGGSSASSGVDGAVFSIVLEGQSTLYVVGSFNQALGEAPIPLPGGFASYSIERRTWTSLGNVSQVFLPGAQFQSVEISVGDAGQPQLVVTGKFAWANGATLTTAPSSSGMASVAIWDIRSGTWIQETAPALASQGQRFEFGYVRGQISYLNRIMGSVSSSGSGNTTTTQPIVLVAGMIDSLDTYQATQPENMAWLNAAGSLRTMNLVPSISISTSTGEVPPTNPIANSPVLPTTNAGIMYLNRTSQAWITIVGGSRANGSIGAGYFYSPPVPSANHDSTLSFQELNLQGSVAVGEILALGLSKSEVDGYNTAEAGSELLLLGGVFKSPSTSGANTNGLVVYDLSSDQLVTGFSGLRSVSGRGEPVVNVIKSKPGQRILVIAGDFAGVGKATICEGVCLWDPVLARQALDKRKSLDGSFKSLYGDNGGKKNLGVLKGVVNDIAFEDDKNMYVAGDLVVNGVACGVASFNFDIAKWTTFGSMITPEQLSEPAGAGHPPGSDTLTGPVTAIAHDSMFHRFFIAGRSSIDGSAYFKKWDGAKFIRVSTEFLPQSDIHRLEILPANKNAPIRNNPSSSSSSASAASISSSSSATPTGPNGSNDFTTSNNDSTNTSRAPSMPVDPNDTTHILEQGFILLVSGRIVLGTPLSASSLALKNDHQESSLAFFDGQSWFPYLQSSRNSSKPAQAPVVVGPTVPIQPAMPIFGGGVLNLAATVASHGSSASSVTPANIRIRDQGVFRALAIAHLPRIIARDYLALPYIILISLAISLGLIILIVLLGFLYVWLKRRLSKEEPVPRPKLGSSFMEEDMGYGHGYHTGSGSMGTATGAMASGAAGALASQSLVFKKRANKGGAGGEKEPGSSSSALMSSLGIASALESSGQSQSQPAVSAGGAGSIERGESRKGPRRKNQHGGAAGGESGDNSPMTGSSSQVQIGSRPTVYRPNSTIAEATDALVTEFVKSHEQQRHSMVSSLGGVPGASSASLALVGAAVPMQGHHENSSKEEVQEEDLNGAPPSPDRAGKQARFSGHSLLNQQEGRTSTSSDMTNIYSSSGQGRIASLLAAATGGVGIISAGAARHGHNNLHHQKRPSTPSNAPASPITTMTTPGGNLYASAAGASSSSPSSSAAAIHNTSSTMATTSSTAIPGNPNTVVNGGVIYYAKYP